MDNTLLKALPQFYEHMEEDEQEFLSVDEKSVLEDFCNWVYDYYEVRRRDEQQ